MSEQPEDQQETFEEEVGQPVDENAAEDNDIFTGDGAMHPDHPLLSRAQEALKRQLLKAKLSLEEEVREKTKALKDAQSRREEIGVELYGFQQQLANLQIALEATHENYASIHKIRVNSEKELAALRRHLDDEQNSTKQERAKADEMQEDVDRLSTALKQIELYNDSLKSEIAVTRRATYAAEEALQKLEKEKSEQDFLIDHLQETLKRQNRQLQIYTAQWEAQKRETRAAQETLAEAEAEMEGIFYEKNQLVAQWQSSLLAIQRRDEALKQIENAMNHQTEQAQAIDTEISAYKRDIIKEQVKNEQFTSILQKAEGEMHHLTHKIAEMKEKQEHLEQTYGKLQKSLEQTEDRTGRAEMEAKALATESETVRRIYVKVASDTQDVQDQMVAALGDQATAERSSSKTTKEIKTMRQMVRKEEMGAIDLQNELAKLQVDILNTQSHNDRLEATLKLLDEELKDKERVIERYETDIRRKNDEIEKKTREVDKLNRKYERLTADMTDESTGPLEATISNLNREIQRKGVEAQELQRRWIGFQMDLVGLQNQNNKLSESLATLKCKHTVIFQKRRRLEQQLQHHTRDIKKIDNGMAHLHSDIQRLNTLIAKNSELESILQNDNFNLENEIMADLKTMEEAAARLDSQINQTRDDKRNVLSEIVETEKEIMLWERKIQLEREMQEALDPDVGEDVVGAMKKEIHRMELRHGELLRLQEKLIQEMERSIDKRETIATKGNAIAAKKGPDMTEQQLNKACSELKRSIRDTNKEAQATDQRISELDEQRAELAAAMEETGRGSRELKDQERQLRQEIEQAVIEKHTVLLGTAQMQKSCKRLEDVLSGKYKALIQNVETLPQEIEKASDRRKKIQRVILKVGEEHPELQPAMQHVLLHCTMVA